MCIEDDVGARGVLTLDRGCVGDRRRFVVDVLCHESMVLTECRYTI